MSVYLNKHHAVKSCFEVKDQIDQRLRDNRNIIIDELHGKCAWIVVSGVRIA
jgi:hypothetical protein